jgi:pyruvate/2-oxoglutarate dehydrogenase complex dihydrolipoamide acyltransferase (E2) component
MTKIILPELGEGVKKATVACWHVKVGDTVKEGDEIVEVVTDKATFNVEAPKAGRLQTILVAEGKDSPVGEALGIIE